MTETTGGQGDGHGVRPGAVPDLGAPWTRRRFLGVAAGAGVLAACGPLPRPPGPPLPDLATDPFTLGVASGDPLPHAVVIWTRLAPHPLVGGGMDPVDRPVRWEVARDEDMRHVVRRGWATARPEYAHSVHVDVRGLAPDRPYWYRFSTGGWESPVGRTRTAPPPGRMPSLLTLGLVSCQRFDQGFYTGYADLAASDLDLVVHVGDYIYERAVSNQVRPDPLPEAITLDDYRNRYALYRSDPHLRDAHATAPWLFAWDDHELENNYHGVTPQATSSTPDPQDFLARKAAAYRAYWEHFPLRAGAPTGPELRIYRRARWGRLADLFVLDTRQYRTNQECGTGDLGGLCDASFDPGATMLGADQERWLDDGLAASPARWAVLAQQVVFSRLAIVPGNPGFYNLDQWDGYPLARQRILDQLAAVRPRDSVVLSGDIHASGVSDLLADYDAPGTGVLGAEFVGTSMSSLGSTELDMFLPAVLANNPHAKWADAARRGWVRHEVTPDAWRADYRLVDDARVPGGNVTTATSWVLPRGGNVEQA